MVNPIREGGSEGPNFQLPQLRGEAKIDFLSLLPTEINFEILSYLGNELGRCLQVSKTWKVLASDEYLWNILALRIAFAGKKKWKTYCGEIGKVPPLPTDIQQILKSPCPFFPGKRVEQTQMLALILETVNGKPNTLMNFEEIMSAPKEGYATKYSFIDDTMKMDPGIHWFYGHQQVARSYWVLMTMNEIPKSRTMTYSDQKALIAEVNKQTGIHYELPSALETTICAFMHYVDSGERLFTGESAVANIRCQETVPEPNYEGVSYPVVFSFSKEGIVLCCDFTQGGLLTYDNGGTGVAAIRRFIDHSKKE